MKRRKYNRKAINKKKKETIEVIKSRKFRNEKIWNKPSTNNNNKLIYTRRNRKIKSKKKISFIQITNRMMGDKKSNKERKWQRTIESILTLYLTIIAGWAMPQAMILHLNKSNKKHKWWRSISLWFSAKTLELWSWTTWVGPVW